MSQRPNFVVNPVQTNRIPVQPKRALVQTNRDSVEPNRVPMLTNRVPVQTNRALVQPNILQMSRRPENVAKNQRVPQMRRGTQTLHHSPYVVMTPVPVFEAFQPVAHPWTTMSTPNHDVVAVSSDDTAPFGMSVMPPVPVAIFPPVEHTCTTARTPNYGVTNVLSAATNSSDFSAMPRVPVDRFPPIGLTCTTVRTPNYGVTTASSVATNSRDFSVCIRNSMGNTEISVNEEAVEIRICLR